jgi:hypothetical protein
MFFLHEDRECFKSFKTAFKKITGLSPIEYRNKYNGEVFGVA